MFLVEIGGCNYNRQHDKTHLRPRLVNNSMKTFWRLTLSIALAGLVWLAWQSPLPAPEPASVQASLPADIHDEKQTEAAHIQQWRVITRRVISKEGIAALQHRLLAMHLNPISIQGMENVTMHAFDDAILFKSRKQAQAIAEFWQQHDIQTTVIKAAKGVYLVGLGRLYQAKYAEGMQKQLERAGRKYRYQQRIVPIPVRRFTFPPSRKQQAEQLWKKLTLTGVMMPVLMSETQFKKTYGNSIKP